MTISSSHTWKFQRIGGLDQVVLSTADDILNLNKLDPKLWVALSCPVSGLEFDEKTLVLLDRNKDGHIRIPDILTAIAWTNERLTDITCIIDELPALPLDRIRTDSDDKQKLYNTAKAILVNANKPDAEELTLDDVRQSITVNADHLFNGDCVFPLSNELDPSMQSFIKDAINVIGAVKDISGKDGVNSDIVKAFIQSLQNWITWRNGVGSTTTQLGENTAEAWQLLHTIKNKVDDYFLRSELADYAPQAQSSLNVNEKFIVPSENGLLENDILAGLPLAKIEADKPLNLASGLNPIWRKQVERFAELVAPFLNDANSLTRKEWLNLQTMLEPYAQAILSKPQLVAVDVTTPPSLPIDKLGEKRAQEIVSGQFIEQFEKLVSEDKATPISAADVAALEKLILLHKNLYRLLMNFTSFHDFYSVDDKAAFQIGKLYIDGRCCSLCIPVDDVAKHTTLANYSELFLLYCECIREDKKQTIVAAMTAGGGDLLLEGRNGVFVDSKNQNWDAKVIKIITKPISIRQAVWDPYKRIGRFISDQLNKWATAKDADAITAATGNLTQAASTPTTGSAAPKFDIGRNVGILAAVGLAIGAVGTALASIAQALFGLTWWQFPLVIIGLFVIISGPSVIMAWLKLKQRTLGPLLEASGWAINGMVKINFYLGSLLTTQAELPENAKRCLTDPLKRKSKKKLVIFLIAILLGAAATGGWLWYKGYLDKFTQKTPTTNVEVNTTNTNTESKE